MSDFHGMHLVSRNEPGFSLLPLDQPWLLLGAFVFLAAGCLMLPGSVGSSGIVILSVAVAYWLYRRFPVMYVSFVWWQFFLICFVRRIIDYRSGFSDQNVILAAPLLTALVCAPALFTQRRLWKQPISLPFVLAMASAIYGLGVGVLSLPAKTLLISGLGWFAPLVFGFFVFSECFCGQRREAHMRALVQTFCWGILLMGAYGVYQYVAAPPWDALWMTDTGMSSIGSPEPFAIRVFSTMNGPGALAYALVAGLVLVLCRRGWLSALAAAMGVAALLLSSVRAAWAALAIALLLFLLHRKKYFAHVLLAVVLVGAALAGAAAIFPPARQSIEDRFSTLTDLHDDTSYQDRTAGYREMLPYVEDSPFGSGLGTMDALFQDSTSLGSRDSGVWEIVLSLGWIGGSVYFLALLSLVVLAWPRGEEPAPAETAAACITVGLLCQLLMGSVMVGVTGVTIWSFGAMAMARFATAESRSRKGERWLPDPAAA